MDSEPYKSKISVDEISEKQFICIGRVEEFIELRGSWHYVTVYRNEFYDSNWKPIEITGIGDRKIVIYKPSSKLSRVKKPTYIEFELKVIKERQISGDFIRIVNKK